MINLSFCGSFCADKSLYSMKKSNGEDIFVQTKKVLEIPKIADLVSDDDIVLFGKSTKAKEIVNVKFNDDIIEIQSREDIKPVEVINQIFIAILIKNNKQPKSAAPKRVLEKITELVKEKNSH